MGVAAIRIFDVIPQFGDFGNRESNASMISVRGSHLRHWESARTL